MSFRAFIPTAICREAGANVKRPMGKSRGDPFQERFRRDSWLPAPGLKLNAQLDHGRLRGWTELYAEGRQVVGARLRPSP